MTHKAANASDYSNLLNCYSDSDLASPTRSTVPLLAYWKDPEERLKELTTLAAGDFSQSMMLGFEYQVCVQGGHGKDSHTDLMLLDGPRATAIEAKYTEPTYESVAKWLGPHPSTNRLAVVNGWISAINRAAASDLLLDQVMDCTYQALHRTASACVAGPETRAVYYQVFDHDPARLSLNLALYQHGLQKLAECIGNPAAISFGTIGVLLKSRPAHLALRHRWESGERDLDSEVRKGLLDGTLLDFEVPTLFRVRPSS